MDIDYTKYTLGTALAADVIMVECPLCKKPCHAKVGVRGAKYVHAVRVYRLSPKPDAIQRRARNAIEVLRSCKETKTRLLQRIA